MPQERRSDNGMLNCGPGHDPVHCSLYAALRGTALFTASGRLPGTATLAFKLNGAEEMNKTDIRKLGFALRSMKDCLDWETGRSKAPQLPERRNQLMHIFRKDEGHMEDTPANRAILTALAADRAKYIGTDKAGYRWNSEIRPDGTQSWVRYLDGEINDGGLNLKPQNVDKFIVQGDVPLSLRDLISTEGLREMREWF